MHDDVRVSWGRNRIGWNCWLRVRIWIEISVSLFKGRSPKDRGIFLLLYLGRFAPKPQTRLFPQLSWKSREKRALSKNFSVILSVCWFTNWIRRIVTSDSIGPFWHIFFSNFNAIWQMKNFWLTPFLTTSSRTWF